MTPQQAIANAHAWFENNSGWAPPDAETLDEWAADGVCRSPDDCLVTPGGWCAHGLASWALILAALDDARPGVARAAPSVPPEGGDDVFGHAPE